MMKEELEMTKDSKMPFSTALMTFVSFFVVGLIPLLSYIIAAIWHISEERLFLISCVATGLALVLIGYMKSIVNEKSVMRGILETVLLGGLAAFLAYFAGNIIADWFL